jgi:hypothetical protein
MTNVSNTMYDFWPLDGIENRLDSISGLGILKIVVSSVNI